MCLTTQETESAAELSSRMKGAGGVGGGWQQQGSSGGPPPPPGGKERTEETLERTGSDWSRPKIQAPPTDSDQTNDLIKMTD